MKPLCLLLSALGLVTLAQADVTLAPLFRDHAVLQRDLPLPIWGRAEPGEHVTVSFKGQLVGATTGADGKWVVCLDAEPASAEPATLVAMGKNTISISDILVGEVWLATGQSNMEWPVVKTNDSAREMAGANFPQLRHIKIDRIPAVAPVDTVASTGWQVSAPGTISEFSAVAFYFARDLHRKLGVPVGIVNSTWGGTAVEVWMSDLALRSTQAFVPIDARWQKQLAIFPERQAHYGAEKEAWNKAEEIAKATKTKNPLPWPRIPIGPGTPYAPSELFNGMIAPLQPYAVRGVIWYQGESNWPHPEEYAELFTTMIRSWRAGWGEGDLPFYFVQLANYQVPEDPTGHAWAKLREAQAEALRLRATDMATAIDIGNPKDIHPRNKQEVGRRLALIAKVNVYGIPGDFSGPMFQRAVREGPALRVYFSHAGTGLISYDKPVQSLEVAGADRRFFPATAQIDRGTLVVSAREVKEPVAVRYAWSNNPVANLYNGAGLPAPPFRSDTW